MKNTIILIFTFFMFSFSYSQDWKLLNINSEGQETYTRPHTKNTAWFKKTPVHIQTENNKTVEGYTVQLAKFDCRKKKMGIVAYYEYNKEGSVLDSYQIEDILVKMEYSPPETLGEFMINTFCKKNDVKGEEDRVNDLIGGIKNSNGTDSGSEGNDNRAGDKGQLNGDPYAPSYFGEPGTGGGGSGYGLRGRGRPSKSKVLPECNEEGRVVVEIHVNKQGGVINAIPGKRGTTGASCLYDAAKKTALTYKWAADSKAPAKQVGFIVINFSSKQ